MYNFGGGAGVRAASMAACSSATLFLRGFLEPAAGVGGTGVCLFDIPFLCFTRQRCHDFIPRFK